MSSVKLGHWITAVVRTVDHTYKQLLIFSGILPIVEYKKLIMNGTMVLFFQQYCVFCNT